MSIFKYVGSKTRMLRIIPSIYTYPLKLRFHTQSHSIWWRCGNLAHVFTTLMSTVNTWKFVTFYISHQGFASYDKWYTSRRKCNFRNVLLSSLQKKNLPWNLLLKTCIKLIMLNKPITLLKSFFRSLGQKKNAKKLIKLLL